MADEAPTSETPPQIAEQTPASVEATIESNSQGGTHSSCNNNDKTCAPTSDGDREKSLEYADELMERGSKAAKDCDYPEAAECYSRALEIRVGHYGELAPECVNAYYKYGCVLLYKAQEEADPLGTVSDKDGSNDVSSGKAQEGDDEESDAEDLAEADEDESDLDLAWKMLDVARAIVEKHSNDTMEKVDILSTLAEAPEMVGSTAVVVVLSGCQIITSNCGDSRAVLCRGAETIPLTVDQKPDREDELMRIEGEGGKVINWNGARVFGVLSMSRAIGDRYLRPWIIPVPEITFTTRSDEDECLILASDGLWDVMSNDEVGEVARRLLRRRRRSMTDDEFPVAQAIADSLKEIAFGKNSSDNISIIVVDLKSKRKRQPRQ